MKGSHNTMWSTFFHPEPGSRYFQIRVQSEGFPNTEIFNDLISFWTTYHLEGSLSSIKGHLTVHITWSQTEPHQCDRWRKVWSLILSCSDNMTADKPTNGILRRGHPPLGVVSTQASRNLASRRVSSPLSRRACCAVCTVTCTASRDTGDHTTWHYLPSNAGSCTGGVV